VIGPWGHGSWNITVERASIRGTVEHRGRVVWSGVQLYAGDQELSEAVVRLVAAGPAARSRRAAFILEPPVLQRRALKDLPPVRRPALQALVAHQASRFFRQNGHPLVTDAVWTPSPKGAPRLAQAVAAEEILVSAVLEGAAKAGLRVDAIRPAANTSTLLSLLPATARVARDQRTRRQLRRLASVVGMLWLVVGVVAVLRYRQERRHVDTELARLAAPLAALLAARREMGRTQAMLEAVAANDADRLRIPRLTEELVHALPDSAFLTSLTVSDDGNGRLSGAARRPLQVLARFEHLSIIARPRLEGGTVRDQIGGQPWERFTLAFGQARQ
jgi:hypothetical protein